MSSIVLDVNNMLATNLDGRGIDPAVLEGALAARFKDAQEVFERMREDGSLGFLDLPYAQETARQVQELADGFGQWFEDLVVLGIGGSALGTRCLRDALQSGTGRTGTTSLASTSWTTWIPPPSLPSWSGSI